MTDQSLNPSDKQEHQLEAPQFQPDPPRDGDVATSPGDEDKTPEHDAPNEVIAEGLAQDSVAEPDQDGGKAEIVKDADVNVSGDLSRGNEDQAQHLEENEAKEEEKEEVEGRREEAEVEEEDDEEEEEDGEEDEEEDDDDDEDEEDDDDEDEEPRLKYARLTQHLGPLYRNGDATSSFLVAGDKMIVGTHNGNINIIQLPMFQSLKVYHAHSASVTGISISPFPPPLPTDKPDAPPRLAPTGASSSASARPLDSSPAAASRKPRERPQIPKTPSNDIFVATSSMDGNVCVQSLIDMKDVQLRNFARPVQTVALSPEYKTDRTYLSGGTAGQLILTVGGAPGRSTSTTTGSAAAAASGWLGSMGIGSNTGKDTILHSGEGIISTIKWSLSGKYVVWLNEHGIKIMRSKLQLDSADAEDAWKRIGHIDRPQTEEWDTMASVWKGRVEWIDEQSVESDESEQSSLSKAVSPATEKLKEQAVLAKKSIERLLVGWGGTIWIIHVHPGGVGVGKNVGEKSLGRAEIVKILRMDCIISGISLYTQNLLLVLAYCLPDDDDDEESVEPSLAKTHKSQPSTASTGSETAGGIRRRQNNQPPELRLIDLNSQAEADKDGLSVSRYERLSSGDYHLGVLPARNAASAVASSKGALEALAGLGSDMWNAAINPRSLFSSGASIRSRESGEDANSSMRGSTTGTIRPGAGRNSTPSVHPGLVKPGVKVFIHSPYDCILATRRDLGDHLAWLLGRQQYQRAWELLNDHPEIVMTASEKANDATPQTPSKQHENADDFDDDESTADSAPRNGYSSVDREKRRIGELWIQELIEENDWISAGQVCGRVLTTADRWEKWVWTFAGAKRLDEITNYIPTEPMHPPIPTTIYEVVLGHYLQTDKPRFRELLDRWPTELFDIKTITTVLENQLKYRDVRETSIDDGEKGRDWRIVMESLARLHEANGRHREALKCYIKLHDADSAFRLIRDNHLADAVADDIPSFIGLRVSPEEMSLMTESDLEHATSEAITLLVDEAQHGLLRPDVVVEQLAAQQLNLYIYFYFRGLWKGEGIKEHVGENVDRLVMDSQSLVDGFGDLAVHLFATYDRPLLMEFLKISIGYTYEKAVQECEQFSYYDELVYLYSKTGEMKRALFLIIDRLKNVGKAIEFAKEQDDPDLWEDLLNYSMDKPSFIRGLLEQVGTAINPITLVRRIPEGLEIEGLREGLTHMMKEHEIQYSISSGVARVLRSEVAAAQNELRSGQRKAIKFEVSVHSTEHVDVEVTDVPTDPDNPERNAAHTASEHDHRLPQAGHCARCHEPFTEYEMETLVGYACGHVFHASHLLEMLHKGKAADIELGNGIEQGSGA
ncbi:hypothetical protein AK830_g2303 [Neonectria ditissima]|uniref:Vps41 beta-propeller domain-containing protein n=1 Tax=Neonectria ditissima TaxID=78410 RepID=A0A0P7BSE2_9HYPO|nr:hypothetical protein AK830_g2303 [Neonectria ditissima]